MEGAGHVGTSKSVGIVRAFWIQKVVVVEAGGAEVE